MHMSRDCHVIVQAKERRCITDHAQAADLLIQKHYEILKRNIVG